jgi:phosphoribosylanthranilate isomerase
LDYEEKRYRVKICGTTSVRDAQMAADGGADYLGVLVDVPGSERSRTLDQAVAIAEASQIPVVVLLSGMAVEGVIHVAETLKPFAVHLLAQMTPQEIQELRERLTCQVWTTVYLPARGHADVDTGKLKESMQSHEQAGADAIVIDTVSLAADGTAARYGGTGKVGDWDAARELVTSVQLPVFLAGGINPDNVREAIRRVDPYGVDLATGVEKSKCNRDPEKVQRLMQEVHNATKKSFSTVSQSPEFTRSIGEDIGRRIHTGSVVALCGDLGTGKTAFAQGVAAGLEVETSVRSPTFIIINEHEGKYPFYHIDTYRLLSSNDMRDLGYEEYFYGEGVTVIEWAQKIEDLLPEEHLRVELEVLGDCDRKIVLIPFGEKYVKLVEGLGTTNFTN